MMRLFRIVMLLMLSAITGAFAATRVLAPPRKARPADVPGAPHEAGRKGRIPVLARHFALFIAVLAAGGFLFAASGIYSIRASSGHWDITRWFLSFSSRRAIVTHTIGGQYRR